MKTTFITTILLLFQLSAMLTQNKVEIFGHRGCRGLLPENTIIAFEKAIELNVDGIEWDVVVSKDNELIISHEPYADAAYCLDSNGMEISKQKEKDFNFYRMNRDEIQSFDCGSKFNPNFAEQKKIKCRKPTVQEAFDSLKITNESILFEIKSEKKDYGVYQPFPAEFAKIISSEVAKYPKKENIIFMCFDNELLEELHKILPQYKYVYLTYLPFKSIDAFLKELSFKPYALGMYHHTIKKKDVKKASNEGVKVFAWTVNKENHFNKLIRYGVSGIITDYPDRIK
jgi:glycerophosphoryl diester phosphodiesterase